MESCSTPGRAQISIQMAGLLENNFVLVARGLLQAKGLGEVAWRRAFLTTAGIPKLASTGTEAHLQV